MNASALEIKVVQFVQLVSTAQVASDPAMRELGTAAVKLLNEIKQHAKDTVHGGNCQCERCRFYKGLI